VSEEALKVLEERGAEPARTAAGGES
jgi:hypothetical protein